MGLLYQTFCILDVMPPDEYMDHVNNSVFTNAAVQKALTGTYFISKLPRYEKYRLYITYDDKKKYHPEYDGFKYNGRFFFPVFPF